MTLKLNCGLTNAFLYDASGTFQVPLGNSSWVLVPPAGVTVGATSTAVWAADDTRAEATIGQTSGGVLVVTNGSFPDASVVVAAGFTAYVVTWMACAVVLKSLKGAATQTIPDL